MYEIKNCSLKNTIIQIKDKIGVKKTNIAEFVIDIDFRGTPGRIGSINSDGIIVTCGNNTQENQALLITKIQINDKILAPKDFFKKLWIDLR